ncbi:MAG: hypothetical protein ACRCY4_10615 [Brevinema sp.]
MKACLFLLLCFLTTPMVAQSSASANEQQYIVALEYVYAQNYKRALPILENLFTKVPDSQIAQTLLNVYLGLLQQSETLSQKEKNAIDEGLARLIESNVLPEADAQRLLQLFLQQAVGFNNYSLIEKVLDLYIQQNPENIVAKGMRGYIVAMQLIRKQEQREPVNPYELIQYNVDVASAQPTTQIEKYYVSQAREFMALAYNALGNRRKALSYWRLAYLLHGQPMGSLLSTEVDFLNFAYAAKHLRTLNIAGLDQDQRELYLGILFADGSPESLRHMDAMISSKKTPLSAYEQALSLYRRGLTARAMTVLGATAGTPLRRENPWFYLDLRYKILKRLHLTEELQPVATTMGGMAYLAGKNKLALAYLNDIDENENGEKSYLIGMIYLRENNYPKAVENFRKHLLYPNSRYYSEVLSTLIRITIDQEGQDELAQRYLDLYNRRNGKDTPGSLIIQAKLDVKKKRYEEASNIEKKALEEASLNQQIMFYLDLADFYSSEWLKTNRDKQILMGKARLYSTQAFQTLSKYPDNLQETDLNNYAYISGLSSEMGLDMNIVKQTIAVSMQNPTPEVLDTAAFVAMEAFRLNLKEAENPTPYFDALERNMNLIDDELEYAMTTAPPYRDESTRVLPSHYEIYLHLAAWHWVNGREELSREYEARALRLARNPQSAAQQLNDLKQSWSQVSL